jgi:16S rRNA (uracil1498-N3)-methyltransferase
MTISRIYQQQSLAVNTIIQISDKAFHHLAHVMRVKIGDEIILFNGNGSEYLANISKIHKKYIEVTIISFIDKNIESNLNLHLAQGIARNEKMDFIVQKAVELGVKSITPLITERSNYKSMKERDEKRLQHWQSIIISACEQSGRNNLPAIAAPISYQEWLSALSKPYGFVLTPHSAGKLPNNISSESTYLLIGPEGGLSAKEIESAVNKNFHYLNLGPRILRTETATISALSIVQHCFGDLR